MLDHGRARAAGPAMGDRLPDRVALAMARNIVSVRTARTPLQMPRARELPAVPAGRPCLRKPARRQGGKASIFTEALGAPEARHLQAARPPWERGPRFPQPPKLVGLASIAVSKSGAA